MDPSASLTLAHWESFYVITGSSAAVLMGLMFVVITLIADSKEPRSLQETNAYATPTVVHFTAVFLISAIVSAPWPDHRGAAWALGVSAIAGLVYLLIVLRRLRRSTHYRMVLEDWTWHVVLPFLAYGGLLVAHFGVRHAHAWALYLTGAIALLLIGIGIHNAWDIVTYTVVTRRKSG